MFMKQEQLEDLIQAAKTNKKGLKLLKNAAVVLGELETAAELREMEKTLFPEPEDVKEAKKLAQEINLLFRMVGLKSVDHKVCWLVYKVILARNKRPKTFSIKDAAGLEVESDRLFKED